MKIDVLIKKFLNEQEVYNRVDTIKYDKAHINVITQYLDKNGIANVEEITKNVVFSYMKQSMDDGLKNSSINKNVVMLKRLVKYADDNGYLDDLAPDIRAELKKVEEIKKLKDDCESYDSLDSNQIAIYQDYVKKMKITDTLSLRNKIMFTLFMECGMRRTELALIETKDVDLVNKTIRLAHVKANKPRNVYLSNGAVYLLSLFIPNHTHKYLFVSYQTGEHMTPDAISQLFKRMSKKLGFNVSPHMLRHTMATNCIGNEMPIAYLQKVMGHNNLSTTQRYLHITSKEVQQSVAKYNTLPITYSLPEKVDNLDIVAIKPEEQETKIVDNTYYINSGLIERIKVEEALSGLFLMRINQYLGES